MSGEESQQLQSDATVNSPSQDPNYRTRSATQTEPSRTWGWRPSTLFAAAVIAMLLLPITGISEYAVAFLFSIMMYAALAVGWNILGGYAGYASVGHVAFWGVGGYVSALLLTELGWSPAATFPLAGVFSAIFALVVGYPCLRLRGPYFALVTLVVALATGVAARNLPGLDLASGTFLSAPTPGNRWQSLYVVYSLMLLMLGITVFIARTVQHSRFGAGLFAIREDEEAAEMIGVPAVRLKMVAFVLSAGLAGSTGAIFAWHQRYIEPGIMFDIGVSLMILLVALLGGLNTWVGPLVGSIVALGGRELLVINVGDIWAQVLFGVALVIVVLFLPNGLVGTLRRVKRIGVQ